MILFLKLSLFVTQNILIIISKVQCYFKKFYLVFITHIFLKNCYLARVVNISFQISHNRVLIKQTDIYFLCDYELINLCKIKGIFGK